MRKEICSYFMAVLCRLTHSVEVETCRLLTAVDLSRELECLIAGSNRLYLKATNPYGKHVRKIELNECLQHFNTNRLQFNINPEYEIALFI